MEKPSHTLGKKARTNYKKLMTLAQIMRGEHIVVKKRKERAVETKPRKHEEQDLSKRISIDCRLLELQGYVLHSDRLNSGMAQRNGRWIRLCKEGTADRIIFCLYKLVIFIEVKSKTGKQTIEQYDFMYKMTACGHLYFIIDDWDHWCEVRERYIVNNKGG